MRLLCVFDNRSRSFVGWFCCCLVCVQFLPLCCCVLRLGYRPTWDIFSKTSVSPYEFDGCCCKTQKISNEGKHLLNCDELARHGGRSPALPQRSCPCKNTCFKNGVFAIVLPGITIPFPSLNWVTILVSVLSDRKGVSNAWRRVQLADAIPTINGRLAWLGVWHK